MSKQIVSTWIVPVAAILIFFYFLLYTIPYAPGYGWSKIPLGPLLGQMWSIPDWGFGFFVPFGCLALIYFRRKEITRTPIRGSLGWGAFILLFGIFIYCIGLKAETQYFGFAAVQILFAGLILWFWGFRVFWVLSFTWLFFLFTWPMPFLDGVVALPLRILMSHLSNTALNLLGTPTVQSGTALFSAPDPHVGLKLGQKFQIDIADPCSGLHSLFALLMIAALTAYITIKELPLRWLLFFAAIPLAIVGNMFRILMLAWGTEIFGTSFALGTDENPSAFHMGCGYAVYLVALGLLFGLVTFFNSAWTKRQMQRFTRHSSITEPALPRQDAF